MIQVEKLLTEALFNFEAIEDKLEEYFDPNSNGPADEETKKLMTCLLNLSIKAKDFRVACGSDVMEMYHVTEAMREVGLPELLGENATKELIERIFKNVPEVPLPTEAFVRLSLMESFYIDGVHSLNFGKKNNDAGKRPAMLNQHNQTGQQNDVASENAVKKVPNALPPLTEDQEYFFKNVTEKVLNPSDEVRTEALTCLITSKAIKKLTPHLIDFFVKKIEENQAAENCDALTLLVRALNDFTENPNVDPGSIFYGVFPAFLSLISIKTITETAWLLREKCSEFLFNISKRCKEVSVTEDIITTLSMLIEKKDAHAAQIYVAIFTLGMFDKSVHETHLFPKLKIIHDIVSPQLAKTKQHPVDPLMAAKRVHNFLVRAVRVYRRENVNKEKAAEFRTMFEYFQFF